MKALGVLLCLSLALSAMPSQLPARLVGTVVSSSDQSPLGNATVELRKPGTTEAVFSTKTGGDGSFQFAVIAEGQYQLSVQRDGFVPTAYGQRYLGGPADVMTIASGQGASPIKIALTPDGVIAGRVTDRFGQPMADVSVSAGKLSYLGGRRSIGAIQTRVSNDLGEYRLFSLPPGQYYVTANPPDTTGLAAITYPSAIFDTDGIAVDLRAGAVLPGIDIRLGPPTVARTVRARAVEVETGQRVAATLWNFMGTRVNRSHPAPVFELENVVPGRYTLVAVAGEESGRLSFEVIDKDLDLAIPVGEKFNIAGRLSIEGGNGASLPAGIRINLAADSVLRGPATDHSATPSADGSFLVRDVLPGRFRVTVAMQGLPDSYVKSVRLGRDDGLTDWLFIDRPPGDSLDIVLSIKAAVIEGRVVPTEQGQPIAGTTVVLVPDGDRRSQPPLFQSVVSGKDGAFRFERVPPGGYKVFAWEQVARDSWLVPEFLRRDEDRGRPVQLQEGSRQTVEVPIVPAR